MRKLTFAGLGPNGSARTTRRMLLFANGYIQLVLRAEWSQSPNGCILLVLPECPKSDVISFGEWQPFATMLCR